MTRSELNKAIKKVAEIQGVSKWDVSKKLMEKDFWTWNLVNEAAK